MKKILLAFLIVFSLFCAASCQATDQPNKDGSLPVTSESIEQGGDSSEVDNSSPEGEKNSDGTVDLPMDEF